MNGNNFQPTRLYIKECAGIKYFGKSTKENIYTYSGSGVVWSKRVRKYGKHNVKTLWVSDWYTDPIKLQEFALNFSIENNIVESDEWANLIPENGLDGHSSQAAKIVNGNLVKRKRQSDITSGSNNPRYDSTVYSFIHEDGRKVNMTKMEFRKLCPQIGTGGLAALLRGKYKSSYGWRLSTTLLQDTGKASSGRKSADKNIYEFHHDSGIVENCTRQELIKKYDLNPTHVSTFIKKKGFGRSHKGWNVKNFLSSENSTK